MKVPSRCKFWILGVLFFTGAVSALEVWPTLDAVADRPEAPDFGLPDVAGKVHRLSEYRGKVAMVSFWATWCLPCREEMPTMQRAWDKLHNEGFTILAVDVGDEAGSVQQFFAGTPVKFPVLLDRDSAVSSQWPLKGLPTTFVLDRAGRVRYKATGERDWDHPGMIEQLRALISAK
jgi:peroxiredoxin